MIASAGSLWFYWPLIGWGVAVSIHALVVFTEGRFFGEEWEEQKARQLMQKDDARRRVA